MNASKLNETVALPDWHRYPNYAAADLSHWDPKHAESRDTRKTAGQNGQQCLNCLSQLRGLPELTSKSKLFVNIGPVPTRCPTITMSTFRNFVSWKKTLDI